MTNFSTTESRSAAVIFVEIVAIRCLEVQRTGDIILPVRGTSLAPDRILLALQYSRRANVVIFPIIYHLNTMKTSLLSFFLTGALFLAQPGNTTGQNTPPEEPVLTENIETEPECGGYAPMAIFHVVTNVDGLRLRQRPSKDAPVLATFSKNTRLVWYGNECEEVFEATFNDGIPRKGRWVHVKVWKGLGQTGWVFSGAITLSHIMYDAEFGGGLECIGSNFVNIKRIDSLDFIRQFAQSNSKRAKMGNSPLRSPDGQYALRQLNARQDNMAGLEFVFRQAGSTAGKITLEMVYGNHLQNIAWAKESGKILIEWADEEMGKMYYEMSMPETQPITP